jgi:GTP-binding protein
MIHTISYLRSVYSLDALPREGSVEICISGRSNVGKSSLINSLANRRKLARTSKDPGATRALNYYLVNESFYLVDLPGYGYARVPGEERNLFGSLVNPYLEHRKEIGGIIQLIDSRHGPVSRDFEMLEWLKMWKGRVLYVFSKADKLSASQRVELVHVCEKEYAAGDSVLFSARTGMGQDLVRAWIEETAARRAR